MATGTKTKTTFEDIPVEAIQEAAKSYETVSVRISRRNDRGHLATVFAGISMKVLDVLDIDKWLKERSGGGRYRVECRDLNDRTKYALPPFQVYIEGPPRMASDLSSPAPTPMDIALQYPVGPGFDVGQGTYAPPQVEQQGESNVNWARGLHPSQRAAYLGMQSPAPGATVASDQLAMKQYQEHKAETARQIAKLEALVERQSADNQRLQEQLAAERDRAREERHKVELEMLREQMKLLGERKPETPKEPDFLKLATALAPFAPVFSSMVTSREAAASKGLEVQQAGLHTLMQATLQQANRPDPMSTLLTQIGPLLLPILKEMMDSKSPKAQAELFNSMVENNLNTVAMMAQLIEAFGSQGDEQPWYLAPIKEALNGVVGMTEAYMQGKGGLPGQQMPMMPAPRPQQLAGAPAQKQVAPPAAPVYRTYTDDEGQPIGAIEVQGEEVPSNGKAEAASAMEERLNPSFKQKALLAMLPPEFQTPEWRAIVLGILNQNDAEPLAELIAKHIEHQADFDLLPGFLDGLFDDPVTVLTQLLSPLPVYRENQGYVDTLIMLVATILIDDEYAAPVMPAQQVPDQPAPSAAG